MFLEIAASPLSFFLHAPIASLNYSGNLYNIANYILLSPLSLSGHSLVLEIGVIHNYRSQRGK
jgi:hypothetical protein